MTIGNNPLGQGLSGLAIANNVPTAWSSQWFIDFVQRYLAPADVRNASTGPGVTISGTLQTPATISVASSQLTGPGLSVLGNPTASQGPDISIVGTSGSVLQISDDEVLFAPIELAAGATLGPTVTVADLVPSSLMQAGTSGATAGFGAYSAPTTVAAGDLWYGSDTNELSALAIGTDGYVLGVSGGLPAWIEISPGGSNTDVQFNDDGAFGGSSALTWDNSTQTLEITGAAGNQALIVQGADSADGYGVLIQGNYSGYGQTQLLALSDANNANGVNLLLAGNGDTTPNKTLRAVSGEFQIINSGYNNAIFTLDDAGNFNFNSVGSIEGSLFAASGYAASFFVSGNGTGTGDAVLLQQDSSSNGYMRNLGGTMYLGAGSQNAIGISTDGYVTVNTPAGNSSAALDVQADNGLGIQVNAGALGETAGDTIEVVNFAATTSNDNQIEIVNYRVSDGTDWTTVQTILEKIVDVTQHGYIKFGDGGAGTPAGTQGLILGSTGQDALYINTVGNVEVISSPSGTPFIVGGNSDGSIYVEAQEDTWWASIYDGTLNSFIGTFGSDGMNLGTYQGYPLSLCTDNTTRLYIAGDGAVTINAPSDAQALSISGAVSNYAVVVDASTTTGGSYGLAVQGGTNSSDVALKVANASDSALFFQIGGDGSAQFGSPTGGYQGIGTINAEGLYVNGTACATVAGDNTYVQFNNDGSFGGSSDLTWNGTCLSVTTDAGDWGLKVGNGTVVGGIYVGSGSIQIGTYTDYPLQLITNNGGSILEVAANGTAVTITPSDGTTGVETGLSVSGDITAYRSSTSGVIFLSSSGSDYLYLSEVSNSRGYYALGDETNGAVLYLGNTEAAFIYNNNEVNFDYGSLVTAGGAGESGFNGLVVSDGGIYPTLMGNGTYGGVYFQGIGWGFYYESASALTFDPNSLGSTFGGALTVGGEAVFESTVAVQGSFTAESSILGEDGIDISAGPWVMGDASTVSGSELERNATTGTFGPVSSSARYKLDIQDVSASEAVGLLASLRPCKYKLNPNTVHAASEEYESYQYGLIAEEVAQSAPELVHFNYRDPDHPIPESVHYKLLGPLLVLENRELRARIEALESRIH